MDDQAEAEDIVSHFLIIISGRQPNHSHASPFRLGLACVNTKTIFNLTNASESGSPQQLNHFYNFRDLQDEPAAEIEELPRDDASARHNQSNGLQ